MGLAPGLPLQLGAPAEALALAQQAARLRAEDPADPAEMAHTQFQHIADRLARMDAWLARH